MSVRSRHAVPRPVGFVSIVGAGPGDPELLTYRAIQRLRAADLVLYDGLVPRSIVDLAATAERVSVSKRVGEKTITQEDVSDLIVAEARAGRRVVRLKAGDPFVLGRGGEEAMALVEAAVPFEIVPGVTSATAAPALAGIPVTHRGVASAFVVVSGHGPAAYTPILSAVPPDAATLVVLMGINERARIAACLVGAGWDAATPAAIVTSASQPDERVWIGTLAGLGHELDFDLDARQDPGVIIIGSVVSIRTVPDLAHVFSTEETPCQPTTIPAP